LYALPTENAILLDGVVRAANRGSGVPERG